MRKTCWYTTIHPLRVGAMIGSWNRAALEPIVHFGLYLGAAFQIQDDLLNLTGDEGIRAAAYEAFAQTPDSPDRDFLRGMIDFMLDRNA